MGNYFRKRWQFAVAIIALIITFTFTGCMTTPQGGGDPVYDATKTAQFKAAIQPLTVGVIRRVIVRNPESTNYFQAIADVFSDARDSGAWNPFVVTEALDARFGTLPMQEDWAQAVMDAKNALIGIYTIFYSDRWNVKMDPEKWVWHLTDAIATMINRGIIEAGGASPIPPLVDPPASSNLIAPTIIGPPPPLVP